tara:strand:- start:600 stop:1937 length:1338 start_codon:yes stop_codon:yes gene_type:complete
MEYTNLDYFNYYLKEFCNEITTNYPDFEKVVVSNYRDLLEGRGNKNDLYVKYFISKVNDHMDAICSGDVELFNPQKYIDSETGNVRGLYLLEGVDFLKLWASEHNNDKNKEAVLKYLKLLTVIGRKIVPNNKEILDLLENVGGQVSAPAKVEKTLYGEEEDLDDAGNEPDILGLGSLSGLAGLAGLGSGEMPDIGKLAKTLTESLSKIKIPNMEEMQEELRKNNSNNDESNNESNDKSNDNSTNDDSTNNNEENNNEISESTEEGNLRDNLNKEDENGPVDESESDSPEAPDLANGTSNLFTDLAQEMASTFDFDNIEKDGQPENMGEAFGKFMSGNNPTKLMGLVSKFGNRLQTDISSGKVNHQDLLKDTTSMMQGLQDGIKNPNNLKKQAKKMAKNNPKMMAQMQQMQKNMQNNSGSTKDRLRAKLEARKAAAAKESTSSASR